MDDRDETATTPDAATAPAEQDDPRARWRTLPAAVRPDELVETQPEPPRVVPEPDQDRELIKRFGTF